QYSHEFTGLVEHLPGVARLVAVLQQGAAGGSEFLGRSEHYPGVWETRSVENRVESRKLQHGFNCRDAACRVSDLLRTPVAPGRTPSAATAPIKTMPLTPALKR